MTRINTNVSSLIARNNLTRANASLSQSLTRLSTGLRINTGKDDPAGLIASENLRSDITAISKAISNTDRANQVIATADSALGQVSSLLNDIRGLVTESANAGALSDEQITANQLQVDSSLEALNRIAQTTTFQGRRLLDGSLDFITRAGNNFGNLSDLQIDQANLGATGTVAVDVEVTTAATQAAVDVSNIPSSKVAASGALSLNVRNASATPATVDVTLGEVTAAPVDAQADYSNLNDGTLAGDPTFNNDGLFRGATGDNLVITFAEDSGTVNHTASLLVTILQLRSVPTVPEPRSTSIRSSKTCAMRESRTSQTFSIIRTATLLLATTRSRLTAVRPSRSVVVPTPRRPPTRSP